MNKRHLLWIAAALALAVSVANGQHLQPGDSHSASYRAIEQKLAYLKLNAARPHPDPRPTELTEPEVNSYFAEGGVRLPKGVSQVHLAARPGVIDGHAHVDFEELMQGRGKNNPMYSMFSGSHDVHVVAEATGANGIATIKTQTIELDGTAIPDWVLQLFVQRFITPRYPNVGMTSTFKLPLRIQTATVESGKVVLVQR
jgi:hypothetical protein